MWWFWGFVAVIALAVLGSWEFVMSRRDRLTRRQRLAELLRR